MIDERARRGDMLKHNLLDGSHSAFALVPERVVKDIL